MVSGTFGQETRILNYVTNSNPFNDRYNTVLRTQATNVSSIGNAAIDFMAKQLQR